MSVWGFLCRIIEIEWAVKNGKPFNPSPKKARKKASKKSKKPSAAGKGSRAPSEEVSGTHGTEAEIVQENVGAPLKLSKKRHASELQDSDVFATPPKKTRLEDVEEMDEVSRLLF